MSTAIVRVVEGCFSLTSKGYKEFRSFMFIVAMLSKALCYLGLHAVLCDQQ